MDADGFVTVDYRRRQVTPCPHCGGLDTIVYGSHQGVRYMQCRGPKCEQRYKAVDRDLQAEFDVAAAREALAHAEADVTTARTIYGVREEEFRAKELLLLDARNALTRAERHLAALKSGKDGE